MGTVTWKGPVEPYPALSARHPSHLNRDSARFVRFNLWRGTSPKQADSLPSPQIGGGTPW